MRRQTIASNSGASAASSGAVQGSSPNPSTNLVAGFGERIGSAFGEPVRYEYRAHPDPIAPIGVDGESSMAE